MVLILFVESPLMRGLLLTILGVSFWVGGVVLANYVWKRYRGERE